MDMFALPCLLALGFPNLGYRDRVPTHGICVDVFISQWIHIYHIMGPSATDRQNSIIVDLDTIYPPIYFSDFFCLPKFLKSPDITTPTYPF